MLSDAKNAITGTDTAKESVEHAVVRTVQRIALELTSAGLVEHAKLDALGMVGKHRKVDAAITRLRAEGLVAALFELGGQRVVHGPQSGNRKIVASGGKVSTMD